MNKITTIHNQILTQALTLIQCQILFFCQIKERMHKSKTYVSIQINQNSVYRNSYVADTD